MAQPGRPPGRNAFESFNESNKKKGSAAVPFHTNKSKSSVLAGKENVHPSSDLSCRVDQAIKQSLQVFTASALDEIKMTVGSLCSEEVIGRIIDGKLDSFAERIINSVSEKLSRPNQTVGAGTAVSPDQVPPVASRDFNPGSVVTILSKSGAYLRTTSERCSTSNFFFFPQSL